MSDLKTQITEQMKDAMRAKDKARLGTIRLILADIKRIEVDERIELDDARVLQVLDKMVKQRRDSIAQYLAAERPELADKEQQELEVIKTFLPQPLSDEEINAILDDAIATTGASSMADMGKVMGVVKPKIQGRADMGVVSKLVKAKL
ncbi:aspartyl-tRNA amidotransferase subunit B [Marinobacterium zhoushanense]|uniref:Aspartyl-tRNA amidotransferase subunit B n=1 Tax=Marinobacterium zhoushanense TaxID=1679163 RepID=A0ABQ1KTG8_9GAMM|nr:GatB/YqeY domain-containing protein [Marinobacterium zhoushanense]GGC06592.1 aspartyl-tRNA amidotransferase subunit B [Marinobacterium zhoushanense]